MERLCWLVIFGGVVLVGVQIWQDRWQYPRFKAMTDTGSRQRMYRYWVIDSFFRYGMLGVAGLVLIRRQDSLVEMPADFALALSGSLSALHLDPALFESLGMGVVIGLIVGITVLGVLPLLMRKPVRKMVVAGDIAALIPRNRAEIRWGALLSINAGFSEEVFFRLLLPLAWYCVCGNALVAVLLASVTFGLVHAYQGLVGVFATFVVGLALALVYIATRQIFLAMLLHALIDLRALVFAPLAVKRT